MGTLWNLAVAQDTRQFLDFEKADEFKAELRSLARQPVVTATNPWDQELAQSVSNLRGELSGLGYGMDSVVGVIGDLRTDLNKGMMGLGALFQWGMTSVIGLLEKHQTAIYETRDLLKYPKRTAANEERENAELALKNAAHSEEDEERQHWLDQALKYYGGSAENYPFDYTVHLDLGKLLLLEYNRAEESLSPLRKAVRTAQTAGDQEFESKAHFFTGRAQAVLGNLEEAYTETNRALDLQPDAQVLAFECARYCALTGRADECATHVESLVRADATGGKVALSEGVAWWTKVQTDDDFKPVKSTLRELLGKLSGDANSKLESLLGNARQAINTAAKSNSMVASAGLPVPSNPSLLNDALSKLVNVEMRSYFQCIAAILNTGKLITSAMNEASGSLILGINKLQGAINSLQQRMSSAVDEAKQSNQERIDQLVKRRKAIEEGTGRVAGMAWLVAWLVVVLVLSNLVPTANVFELLLPGLVLSGLPIAILSRIFFEIRKSIIDSKIRNIRGLVHKPDDSLVSQRDQLNAKKQELERALSRVLSGGFL